MKYETKKIETDFGMYEVDESRSDVKIAVTVWSDGAEMSLKPEEWQTLVEELPEALLILTGKQGKGG